MCSPAQLRQQSEELYAVIDEILANSIAAVSLVFYFTINMKLNKYKCGAESHLTGFFFFNPLTPTQPCHCSPPGHQQPTMVCR